MRVGTITLLHEPDGFDPRPTTLADFRFDTSDLAGGFEAVPLFHANAPRGGPLAPDAYAELKLRLLRGLADAGPLDGMLLEADGSAESDGDWVAAVRGAVGAAVPLVAVVATHANPSPQLIQSVDALVTTRAEAADILARTLRREVRPAMSAVYLPMAVSLDARGSETARALSAFAEEQRAMPLLLSNAVLFGNPNVDGPHLGATAVVVTDNDSAFARNLADDLANAVWEARRELRGALPAYWHRPRPLWPFESGAGWEPRGEFR